MKSRDARFQRFLDSLPDTPEHPCAYYPERQSRLRAFLCQEALPPDLVDRLINSGFRRAGDFYYTTRCPGCSACLSYRVPVSSFQPSRSQKRILRNNADVQTRVVTPQPTTEKERLYLRYQYKQHFLKPVPGKREKDFDPESTLETMMHQMYTATGNSVEFEFRVQQRLVTFGVLDMGENTLSAVYSVYDLEMAQRSLGTYFILAALEWARDHGVISVNLGYYLPGHPKMDYKKQFRPAQILDPATAEWESADHFLEKWCAQEGL